MPEIRVPESSLVCNISAILIKENLLKNASILNKQKANCILSDFQTIFSKQVGRSDPSFFPLSRSIRDLNTLI